MTKVKEKSRIPAEPLLTAKQAAEMVGIHPMAFGKICRSGRGPDFTRWSKRKYYTRTLLSEWLSENRVDSKVA